MLEFAVIGVHLTCISCNYHIDYKTPDYEQADSAVFFFVIAKQLSVISGVLMFG